MSEPGGPDEVPWWAKSGGGTPSWWQEPEAQAQQPAPMHAPFSPGPNPGYRQAPRPTEGLAKGAVASVVWGVLSLLCCGLIFGPIAIYQGSQARFRIQVSNGRLGGNALALLGMLLGGVSILWSLFSLYWYATGHRVGFVGRY